MPTNRRAWLKSAAAASTATALSSAQTKPPTWEALDKAAAQPILQTALLKSPVIIESMRLLKKGNEYIVQVRSTDGAEGVSLANPPRGQYLYPIFNQLVAPFFKGKDARDLEDLLWGLYRWQDNYKLYGLALWSPQAWAEFAILDLLGRVANKSIGELLGGVRRKEIAFYVASGRRDTTPEQEIDYLQKLVQESGAKALKFRIGGVMSRNQDASPNRSDHLIPLVGKTFGGKIDIHADSNSSYDPPLAIKYGRMLEEIKSVYYEEPCPFDHLEDTKKVADALTIPVAGGEQEYSDWRFKWMIANRGVDIVQPDIHYYGGLIRSIRVARMAELAGMSTTAHISGGFGFVYMLHFASVIKDPGRYQEYKMGTGKYGNWFSPAITVKNGLMSVPTGPGVGITDIKELLAGASPVS